MPGLRWFKGKQLVSLLRNGDYTHAGGEEAIITVMSKFNKNTSQNILDVGCGQGGTANFIQQHGWGKVTGIDIEEISINYARKTYLDVEFKTSDVIQVSSALKNRTFDIICLYNSFYAFANQEKALKTLNKLAHNKTKMVIYDYTDICNERNPFLDTKDSSMVSIPVKQKTLEIMLKNTGWILVETIDNSKNYVRWYATLLSKLKKNKMRVIHEFGKEKYLKTLRRYTEIYNYLVEGKLGGGIFYINSH
ncbi:MAG: methyltransferase domain-containing protein [Gammaproteobacteria bacterium]|jgi:ubiquinone/menaquinone biosynthesis C-methylase UbiE